MTESAVLRVDALMHELVSSNGAWLTLRGIATGVEVRKSLGSGLLSVDPCPNLVPGADTQIGNLHCSHGSLRRMDGLAVTAVYPVAAGYRLRDLWSESMVLLERDADHALLVGELRESPQAIVPTTALGIGSADLDERLQLVSRSNQISAVYRSGSGYRVLSNATSTTSVAAAGELLPRQQCIAGEIVPNRLVAVERVNGALQLRIYDTFTLALVRQDPLQVGDRLVCTAPGSAAVGAYILRAQAGGDQIFRASSSGLILTHTAADPVRGSGQLLSVGQVIFVRYADGSLYRLASFGSPPLQTALTSPSESPRPIEAGTLATDPVREYALSGTAAEGMAQIAITERAPVTGQIQSTVELPLGVNLAQSGFTSVNQVVRHADWPAQRYLVAVVRKAIGAEPAGLVYYSIQGAQAPAPLLDQFGAQPTLDNLVLSGPRVHALHTVAATTTLMRFGNDGNYEGQTAVQASQLVGQLDGSVLALRGAASGAVVVRLSMDVVSWEQPLATACRLLDLDAYPLVSCQQGVPSLSTLSRLDAQTGAPVWQRMVTPLDLQLPFDGRTAWTQDAELRVLSWASRSGGRALCVARIDPQTGALLGVSNVLSLTTSTVVALGVHGFPYTHRWIHLLALDGSRRQRIAVRVDSNGTISANLLGQSLITDTVYLSETVDRMATNEGVRWFVSSQVQGTSATTAQAFPQTSLSLPLSLSYSVAASLVQEDRAGVQIRILNPDPNIALAARLHVGLLNCPEINHQSATADINVPANSVRTLDCVANFSADSPLETTVYLRQPLNGVITRDFVTLPITIGTLGRDGFEGDGVQ